MASSLKHQPNTNIHRHINEIGRLIKRTRQRLKVLATIQNHSFTLYDFFPIMKVLLYHFYFGHRTLGRSLPECNVSTIDVRNANIQLNPWQSLSVDKHHASAKAEALTYPHTSGRPSLT